MNDLPQHAAGVLASPLERPLSQAPAAAPEGTRGTPAMLPLAGYPIIASSLPSARSLVRERLESAQKTVLLFANTNFVMQCRSMLPWLKSKEVLLLNDGVGLDIAALLKHGQRYPANLNGTDFVPAFLRSLTPARKVFLFGGKPGIARKAAMTIERQTGQQVVGFIDGYNQITPTAFCSQINDSGAEIILVALGNPMQESWIQMNMHTLNAPLIIGVGALFDFLSGETQRAPGWVQSIRCEWIFRLMQEPRRLLRRYTLDIPAFLYLCLRKQKPLA
ncbi:MAG: hypothetical protein RIR00_486 [Pseudomonadota bacterium]